MEFKCNCTNSGTNCFTGACNICGMSKSLPQESITEKMKELQLINNLKLAVLSLQRYENSFGEGFGSCWGEMVDSEDGEWVRLEDVLALFSAKKE